MPGQNRCKNQAPYFYRISILTCGDSMTEERKHAILFAFMTRSVRPNTFLEKIDER